MQDTNVKRQPDDLKLTDYFIAPAVEDNEVWDTWKCQISHWSDIRLNHYKFGFIKSLQYLHNIYHSKWSIIAGMWLQITVAVAAGVQRKQTGGNTWHRILPTNEK